MLHYSLDFLHFFFFLEEMNTSGISVHHIRDESQACRLEGHPFFCFVGSSTCLTEDKNNRVVEEGGSAVVVGATFFFFPSGKMDFPQGKFPDKLCRSSNVFIAVGTIKGPQRTI